MPFAFVPSLVTEFGSDLDVGQNLTHGSVVGEEAVTRTRSADVGQLAAGQILGPRPMQPRRLPVGELDLAFAIADQTRPTQGGQDRLLGIRLSPGHILRTNRHAIGIIAAFRLRCKGRLEGSPWRLRQRETVGLLDRTIDFLGQETP